MGAIRVQESANEPQLGGTPMPARYVASGKTVGKNPIPIVITAPIGKVVGGQPLLIFVTTDEGVVGGNPIPVYIIP